MTAPPTIYSSAPPSIAVAVPRAPRPTFAAAAAVSATRMAPEAREERMFLRNAAAQSRFELEASRQAFAKSSNPRVRELSAALINHHNTVGLELAHLLNARGMAAPMLSNEQTRALKRMNKLAGSKFDAVYMQQVGMGQAAVARDYEKASAVIHEPQVNAWIVKTLANTRYFQNMAERSLPADPQLARWNRAGKPQTRAPMPGVQPVSSTATAVRLSVSNSR
ncbi:DUF4142 domain-containing protein [Caenimonas terrae]|uniref:DUF4142 domain-containing protein n=1 Tax=Caenimonas terrae TaxID=696074 RepID=A0ABW0NGB7_9BURK